MLQSVTKAAPHFKRKLGQLVQSRYALHQPSTFQHLSSTTAQHQRQQQNPDTPSPPATAPVPHSNLYIAAGDHDTTTATDHLPRDHPTFAMQSKRRVLGSPTLALEAVAVSPSVQSAISKSLKSLNLRPSHLRARARLLQRVRAAETYKDKRPSNRGPPHVTPPPEYTREQAAAYLATRFPGSFAAATHALAETRRQLPRFSPRSLLDFGSGAGTCLIAASRVLSSPLFAQRSTYNVNHDSEDLLHCVPRMPISHAWLVDHSPAMKDIASAVTASESDIRSAVDIMQTKSLADGPPKHRRYDLVCAAYSLSEVVRSTLIKPDEECMDEVQGTSNSPRGLKEKAAEARLKKLVRSLWRRTAPGGLLVIVEDGTAAGFETVLFARELVLSRATRKSKSSTSKEGDENGEATDVELDEGARIIAPCVHSKQCPLDGTVTRHRICRFVQRLNRPPFQREALPKHDGFEDEYFSYIVIQKTTDGDLVDNFNGLHRNEWGRLIRAPLRKGKHIAIDACTHEAKLERRVVSKRKAPDGYYARARRSTWGDIWPVPPSGKPSEVNF